jgi:hypothetical protein
MRFTLAIVVSVPLAIGAGACGSGSKGVASGSGASSAVAGTGAGASAVTGARSQGYRNDGDAEKVNDRDMDNSGGNHEDGDADSVEEYEETYDNGRYHDSDDANVLAWGHTASAADKRVIAATVERYYTAAVAQDGAAACSMMVRWLVRSIPENYGRGSVGPSYLRSGRTCQAVMSLLFKHLHRRLTTAIAVTEARVNGDEARMVLGSRTMPAGVIAVKRESGAWKINGLLGGPLP